MSQTTTASLSDRLDEGPGFVAVALRLGPFDRPLDKLLTRLRLAGCSYRPWFTSHRDWYADCPCCGASLAVKEHEDGHAWCWCVGGCEWPAVLARLGLEPLELCLPISDKEVQVHLVSAADDTRQVLLNIEPVIYVEALTDQEVPSYRKVYCPLHDERTPSFHVYDGEKGWHCFSCGKGGDIFTLASLLWGIDTRRGFPELIRRLRLHFHLS